MMEYKVVANGPIIISTGKMTGSENYFYWRGYLTGLFIAFIASGILFAVMAVARG
jgi:hypothetical protein